MTTERIEKVVAEEKEEKLGCGRADVILTGADEQAIDQFSGKHRAPRVARLPTTGECTG